MKRACRPPRKNSTVERALLPAAPRALLPSRDRDRHRDTRSLSLATQGHRTLEGSPTQQRQGQAQGHQVTILSYTGTQNVRGLSYPAETGTGTGTPGHYP